jgi:single-strand DNA-binding protein
LNLEYLFFKVSNMFNRVYLIGNIGADPTIRYTKDGRPVVSFPVATQRRTIGDTEPITDWHRVVTFARTAEYCQRNLAKGDRLFIEGELRTSSYEDKNGTRRKTTNIVAFRIIKLLRREAREGIEAVETAPEQEQELTQDLEPSEEPSEDYIEEEKEEEDIPF